MHVEIVSKFIRWHSLRKWNRLAGHYPQWPRVVAILDGTPFQISKPKGMYGTLTLNCHEYGCHLQIL